MTGDPMTRPERASALLEKLGDRVAGVKLNFHIILPRGLAGLAPITGVCARKGLPLIADIKLNDIESTNVETTNLLFENGFDAVIANPFVGREEGLSKVISNAGRSGKGVILLVYMSHAGAAEGYGLKVDGEELFVTFAKRARDWGADGAIVSSKSLSIIRRVREILGPGQLILSPGVGVQGGKADEAMTAGTDFAIVGRSIIEAGDPGEALAAFNRSMPGT
jgi:orotidine-5'-phosphate decarboxylase